MERGGEFYDCKKTMEERFLAYASLGGVLHRHFDVEGYCWVPWRGRPMIGVR
ncbi:hypothetical protein MK489_16700 [Myxococcota bacterium]|nr:hypothetical protein [Myxococcota bacterium]